MIRINLLPHREAKRRERRSQFYAFCTLTLVAAGAIVFVGHTVIDGYVEAQERHNAFLKREIAALDKDIEEIKRLKDQTDALLSRKRVIENLQSSRGEAVNLFNELSRQMPDGVYLKSIRQAGSRLTMVGYAQSNARVSTLMRNLEAVPALNTPELVEIKAVTMAGRRLNEFNLNVGLNRVKPETAGKGGGDKPKPEGKKA